MTSAGKRQWNYAAISIAVCVALVMGLFYFGNASSAATPFADDFEDGNADGWTVQYGTWSVVQKSGGYVYEQSGTGTEGRSSAGEASWTDYSVSADVTVTNFNGSNRVLVAGRYQDGNNYYAASLYNSSGGKLEIRKKSGGSSSTLADKTYPLAAGTSYEVKLVLAGTTIEVYVNGVLELTAADSAIASGGIGLVAKAAVQYDNIVVSDSDAAESPSPSPSATPEPTATPEPSATPTPTPTPSPSTGSNEYDLTGFSAGNTGGGSLSATDSAYRKVYTATELGAALKKGSGVKVVEIMNDLDLGWNEIPSAAQTSPFAEHNEPLTHPVLLQTGVSKITVDSFDGLTIFSANGAAIKHAAITVKRSSNVIIRNLEFDELWEWDESSKGDYDKNDWDYITLEDSSKIWIDHCTFNKAYDGLVDVKKGTSGVTISWSVFKGDDGSSNSWVTQQINALESNPSAYPMYAYLRSSAIGLSKADIIAVAASQKKGHLVGATEFADDNADLEITLHHNYYKDIQDRMPRLRGGNAHAYNIVMDNADAWEAKQLITTAMETALNAKGYKFGVTSNGAISTEDGAVLVEKSVITDVFYPVRNNQTDPSDADYTGKIRVLDTIYSLDGTTYRGDSDTAGSPLAPVPAAVKAFSWNGFTALPYSYTADDPSGLQSRLSASNGAGSGKLSWSAASWLATEY